MAATAEKKELAQALAFAYFAIHPDASEPDHDKNFFGLFSGKENMSVYKAQYLSDNFPIDKIKTEFAVTKTAKTGQLSYHTTAKKVYYVAKACVDKGMFKYPLNQYQFVDQSDPFMLLVKDESLINVAKAFELGVGKQIGSLSAVDLFAVRRSQKQKIVNRFKKMFATKEIIIENAFLENKNDYHSIIAEYLDSGDLIPISLKLPNLIGQTPHVKLIKTDPVDLNVDPFMKTMAIMLQDHTKTEEIVEKAIQIEVKSFRMHAVLNWVFPVIFNYDEVIDPATGKPITHYKLKFNLFAQGHGAGWNGQFDATTKANKDTQWVGGCGPKVFDYYAKQYPEYHDVVSDLAGMRVDAFNEICDSAITNTEMTPTKRSACVSMLSLPRVVFGDDLKVMETFFGYDKKKEYTEMTLYHQVKLNLIRKVNKDKRDYKGTIMEQQKMIDAHFIHAQLSYFITQPKYATFFKKRMFFTIFGLITKMAHKIIEIDDYKGMRNAVHIEIVREGKKKLIDFTSAPHYLLS